MKLVEDKVAEIRATLDNARVGHDGNPNFVGLLSSKPFIVSEQEESATLSSASSVLELISITNQLYLESLSGNVDLQFVRNCIEGEAESNVVNWNRRVAQSGRLRPPCFVRLDQPMPGISVEAQVPGSGWGLRIAINEAYGIASPDMISEFAFAVRALTGKTKPRVVHVRRIGKKFENEGRYFSEAANEAGIDFRISIGVVPDPSEVDLILRHYFTDFLEFPGADKAMVAYLAGDIEIDPPPSLVTDQKIPMIFPFHNQTRGYFSDNVRRHFAETSLVQIGAIEEIMDSSKSNRNFVLKYAGLDRDLRSQGKAVFNLSQCSRKTALEMEEEIVSSERPWLLQKLVRQKYCVECEVTPAGIVREQELYARFTPMLATVGGDVRLMCWTVNFRNMWKVSSHHDSVLAPVRVQSKPR